MRLAILVVILVLTGCTMAPTPGQVAPEDSPCSDSLYVALQDKPLDSMTDREYAYFVEKDRACGEYQRTRAEVSPAEQMVKQANNWTIAVLIVSLISTAAILALL